MSGKPQRRFLLLLVTGITLCLPLFGIDDSFSIGIFPLHDTVPAFSGFLQQTGEKYANTYFILDENQKKFYLDAKNRLLRQGQDEKLSSAYASKSFEMVETVTKEVVTPIENCPPSFPVSYRILAYDEQLSLLLPSNKDAANWYCSKENLDALLLVNISDLSKVTRVEVIWYDLFSNVFISIFDKVSINQNFMDMEESLALSLVSEIVGKDVALIVFDNPIPALLVKTKDNNLILDSPIAFLPVGSHELQLSATGYLSKSISLTLEKNTITHVDAHLEQEVYGPVKLTSGVGNVFWYVNGNRMEKATDFTLEQYSLPLVVVVQKDGFTKKTIQTNQTLKNLTLDLKPYWMNDHKLLLDSQKDFYKSLRNTILMFGMYVASATLAKTYEVGNPLWQPLLVATSGIALVSSLHTIMNLATYTSHAGSGVR